ncbi:hypothetical protein PENTCL1PPCAC_21980, partial [Pristionchus entomophagus]
TVLGPYQLSSKCLVDVSLFTIAVTFSLYGMDIFGIPDVFLRQLMKSVEIKDRLSLRLTCRAFEELVADSHAGCFKDGRITREGGRTVLCVRIGDAKFVDNESSEEGMERFLRLRSRLFSAISIETLFFNLDEIELSMDFIHKVITNFEIGTLRFQAESDAHLEMSMQLMSEFPCSQYTMRLWYLPETEKLLSIPPMENMKMHASEGTSQIPAELFFKLLSKHRYLEMTYDPINFSSPDWKQVLQILSADSRKRRVLFMMERPTIVNYLRSYGIDETSKEGDHRGEFEVTCVKPDSNLMHLRYRHCVMELTRLHWIAGTSEVSVDIANCDEF